MLALDFSQLDYFRLVKESKNIIPTNSQKTLRLALTADFALQHLTPLIKTLFFKAGINAEIFEAPFDTMDSEITDKNSALYAFKPDYIVILNSVFGLRSKYYGFQGDREAFSQETASQVVNRWDLIGRHLPKAKVIQSNFVLPYERFFGNYDLKTKNSFLDACVSVNRSIQESARDRSGVWIDNIEYLASYYGRKNWLDEKLWILAKSFSALEYLPLTAKSIADIVLSCEGQGVKCVVLDLDNTLWGGVIGEDGLEQIRIGPWDEGLAFQNFQRFLLELKRRGILLAVCSKNDPANAALPFTQHSDMILRRDDFAVFIANWENKAQNLREIQRQLNIGFDSMVFIDDDPFERNLIRRELPQVAVPEMPEDSADYVKYLSELNLFETSVVSNLDADRTRMIQIDQQRQAQQKNFVDLNDYLSSLEMKMTIARFDKVHLSRIAQLIQRSNQFNLTTRRYAEAECEAFMSDGRCFPLFAKLRDRFGDSGLISVVILFLKEGEVEIDAWLMSCRVLMRGVEQHVMNTVVRWAKENGYKKISGEYIPSAKNKMVENFYESFGFKPSSMNGASGRWQLNVEDYRPKKVFIEDEVLLGAPAAV